MADKTLCDYVRSIHQNRNAPPKTAKGIVDGVGELLIDIQELRDKLEQVIEGEEEMTIEEVMNELDYLLINAGVEQ